MNNRAQLQFSKDNTANFSTLYRKYWPLLCNYGAKYIPDPADVEDLVTDVFIRFLDKPRSFDNMVAVRAFLFKSVFNACINWSVLQGRRQKNFESLCIYYSHDWEDYSLSRLIRKEAGSELLAAIETIPPQARKVCKLLYLKGMNYDQVAAQLNISRNTVKNHQTGALKVLRKKFPQREFLFG
jgi:RNA polymerase sigma-70 factor (ECF subfamily)